MRSWVTLAIAAAGCGGAPPPAQPARPPQLHQTRTIPAAEEVEPEDGIDVVSTRGQMDTDAIVAGLEPHKQALSDCYLSRIGTQRWLGGDVSLRWEVSQTGEVIAVRLAESTLGSWAVERCLLEVARGVSFGKPRGGATDFSIPLAFTAKGRVAIWDEDQSLRAVGGQLAMLDECAKPAPRKPRPTAPRLPTPRPDDVTITLYVGAQGKAQSVGFASPSWELDDTWAECAEKVALAWRLPDPRGRIAKLAVRYR
jgi:TonB family protein